MPDCGTICKNVRGEKMNSRDRLNEIYKPLCGRANDIMSQLREFECTYGFYDNHSHKNEQGEYVADFYPIPVISVKGICDIEIDFAEITVTAKLTKEKALSIDYSKTRNLVVYGVEDYLTDYYTDGDNIETSKAKISESTETEFFYTFSFPSEAFTENITAFVIKICEKGFFY